MTCLQDYNCSVDFVSSPFLVRQSAFKGKNGSFETLRLDLMEKTTSMYSDADIIIFNTGHWWTHEKTSRGLVLYFISKASSLWSCIVLLFLFVKAGYCMSLLVEICKVVLFVGL